MDTQCSDKLGTLLCFIYFPFCSVIPGTTKAFPIFPCLDLCEEVTNEESQCTQELKKANIPGWGAHFNCSEFMYDKKPVYINPDEEEEDGEMRLCVNHTQVPWFSPEPTPEPKGPKEPVPEEPVTEAPSPPSPETQGPPVEPTVCTPSCGKFKMGYS